MADEDKRDGAPAWRPQTELIHGGIVRSQWAETSEALYLTQGFVYNSAEQAEARFKNEDPGFQYSRFGNPTVSMFEDRLKLFEGAEECRATATGMAAVTASMLSYMKTGDHVVAGRAMFGSCRYIVETLCPRFGIACTLIDGKYLDAWKKAIQPNTKMFFFETPSNPNLELVDIAGVAQIAKAHGILTIVDNVFATPMLQRPLQLGADIVVYSATKHIDGQGRVLGGAILGGAELMTESYKDILRHTGPALSPFNSWVLLKALETLELRVTRQTQNAARVADAIGAHAKCRQVIYPGRPDHPQAAIIANQMSGGGSVVAFDLGSREAAWRFLDTLAIVDISNNLGDAKSMATHPSTTTHRSMPEAERLSIGLTEGWVRMSLGLEGAVDLVRDVERALDAA